MPHATGGIVSRIVVRVLAVVLAGREELAELFRQVTAGSAHVRKRDQFVEKMALATIVAQEQWLSMYLRYIGIAER